MITAFMLIIAEKSSIDKTAQALLNIDGVSEVYSLAGEWDLFAKIRTRSTDKLEKFVTKELLQVESIEKTRTLIAFKAYNQHDLERMFSIGLEERCRIPF